MTSLLMSSLPTSTSYRLFRCRYSTSRDVVVSSPSSSRAPRRVCSQARKTLLLKSTSISIFLLSVLRPTFHATPEKICARGLNEALRAEFLPFRNNTKVQRELKPSNHSLLLQTDVCCYETSSLPSLPLLSTPCLDFRSMWIPRPSLGQSKKAVGGTKTSFFQYKFIETIGKNRCFTHSPLHLRVTRLFFASTRGPVGTTGLPVPSQRVRFARGTRLIQRCSERVPSS